MCKKISLEKATREFINHHSRAHTKDQHQLIPSTSLHSHSSSSCASVPAIMTVDCHHQRRNKAWETWLLKREKKSGERDWGKLQASSSTENTEKKSNGFKFKFQSEKRGQWSVCARRFLQCTSACTTTTIRTHHHQIYVQWRVIRYLYTCMLTSFAIGKNNSDVEEKI
jgi:hypothetical protein